MKLYPTSTAVNLSLAGAAMVGAGLVSGHAAVVGWGAAVLLGVVVARAATLVSVARIRAAGFEMLWTEQGRSARVTRGAEVVLQAEVRNRDTLAARYVGLRAIASSQLSVTLEPAEGEVPASGRLKVSVRVRAPRVGRHGIFGLALEVQGAPGLFEVPLTFANPFGIDVRPASPLTRAGQARGGRTRIGAEGGKAGRSPGEGSDLREVREHRSGDPFRRIAWRASARRGKLMVREMEHEERDTVWVLLDASVELWAGSVGHAPLDLLIDDAAALIDRHLGRGDKVGLVMLATRVLRQIDPGRGPAHGAKLHEALAHAAATHDRDRSDLDEADVASRVLEHLRPLDPGAGGISRRDLDRLAQRAAAAASAKAPFSPEPPEGPTPRERRLRQYLAAFGIESAPRGEPEGAFTQLTLLAQLARLSTARGRPSVVYIAAPAPTPESAPPLAEAIRRVGRGASVRWVLPRFDPSLGAVDDGRVETGVLLRATRARARFAADRGARLLRRMGVSVERARAPRRAPPPAPEGTR